MMHVGTITLREKSGQPVEEQITVKVWGYIRDRPLIIPILWRVSAFKKTAENKAVETKEGETQKYEPEIDIEVNADLKKLRISANPSKTEWEIYIDGTDTGKSLSSSTKTVDITLSEEGTE